MLAAGLRMYKLAEVPSGMTWDEAAIGYNGYAVWKVHRDEWLVRMPISFRSFGDYKAPLAIYINGFFTFLFDLNLWAVRLPFALAGVMTVAAVMLMVRVACEVFLDKTNTSSSSEIWDRQRLVALLAGLTLAISPWHLHFSRAGFESGMALALVVCAVSCYLFSLYTATTSILPKRWAAGVRIAALLAAVVFFVAAMYTYHSAKIVVPGIVVLLGALHVRILRREWKLTLAGIFLAVILLIPMAKDTFWGKGGERFMQTSVFSASYDSTPLSKAGIVVGQYLKHFTPEFLLFGETITLRHGDGKWGVLYLSDIFFILIGLIPTLIAAYWWMYGKAVETKENTKKFALPHARFFWFASGWVVIGLLPAAIGAEAPHANRALLALPGFVLLSAYGFHQLLTWLQQLRKNQTQDVKVLGIRMSSVDAANLVRIAVGMTVLVMSVSFLSYTHHYHTRFVHASEMDFKYGYQQAFEFARTHEDEVEKIIFTSKYGQPYIYAIFFRRTDPIWYQGGSLIKYEFPDSVKFSDLYRQNALIIATPEEIDASLADELVIAPSGKVMFVMVKTKVE